MHAIWCMTFQGLALFILLIILNPVDIIFFDYVIILFSRCF